MTLMKYLRILRTSNRASILLMGLNNHFHRQVSKSAFDISNHGSVNSSAIHLRSYSLSSSLTCLHFSLRQHNQHKMHKLLVNLPRHLESTFPPQAQLETNGPSWHPITRWLWLQISRVKPCEKNSLNWALSVYIQADKKINQYYFRQSTPH